jgi:hypothetical protein
MVESKQTFPFKLYQTIDWASESEFSSALSWSPSGHAFVVHDREKMVEHIIPKFFDHKKWRSFTRQLNLWGFKRELRGPDSNGETYYHQHFKRGKLDELQLIKRTEIKRRSITKPLIDSSPRNSSATVNRHGFELQGDNPQRTLGDISRGASFLTSLKASPDDPPPQMNSSWPIEVASEGGLLRPAAAYGYGNLQGRQISHMLPYTTASLAPHTMQSTMQQQMLLQNPQLMMQPQMSQECLSRGYRPPNNHLNYEMLNQMSTQQLIAMASRLNGMHGMNGMARMNGTGMNGMASMNGAGMNGMASMNGTGMVQARSLSGSSLTSSAEPRTVSGSSIMSSIPNAASNIFNKGNKTHEDQHR